MVCIIIQNLKRKCKNIFLVLIFLVLKCLHHCNQLSKLSEQLNNNKSLVKFSNCDGGQSTSPCSRATRGLIATSWQLPFPNAHAQCKTEKVKVIFSWILLWMSSFPLQLFPKPKMQNYYIVKVLFPWNATFPITRPDAQCMQHSENQKLKTIFIDSEYHL